MPWSPDNGSQLATFSLEQCLFSLLAVRRQISFTKACRLSRNLFNEGPSFLWSVEDHLQPFNGPIRLCPALRPTLCQPNCDGATNISSVKFDLFPFQLTIPYPVLRWSHFCMTWSKLSCSLSDNKASELLRVRWYMTGKARGNEATRALARNPSLCNLPKKAENHAWGIKYRESASFLMCQCLLCVDLMSWSGDASKSKDGKDKWCYWLLSTCGG